MKILYLGNRLAKHGKTPTGIDFMVPRLRGLSYEVKAVSSKKNKVLRLLEMWTTIVKEWNTIDYILIDTYSTLNFWYAVTCAKLARRFSIPYVCILRGGDLPHRITKSRRRSDELFKNAHTNIGLSKYLVNTFQDLGYENITYIENTIELKNYSFQLKSLEYPKLLWVRSFSEIYNPQLAILILEEIKKDFPQAELCMVGPDKDGSLEKCKQLAKRKQLSVKFTGKLSKEEWIKLSKDYNLFINTTNFDNTPISVIEAMALGLPVISTNVGGLPFLIAHEKDGILVEKEQVAPFIREIKILVTHPERAYQLAAKARKKVEQFDWEVVKEKWKRVLQ